MDPCLLSRRLEIICEKERGAWWKHGRWRQARREGAPSALVCLPCTPCSFWRPLILSSACYTGYIDPKLHWPFWILWLGLCSDMPLLISVRRTQSSYGKESVLSLDSITKHGLLCYWCCFVTTVFVSPFSKELVLQFLLLNSRGLEIICEKERGAWWKLVWCRHTRGRELPLPLCVSLAPPVLSGAH